MPQHTLTLIRHGQYVAGGDDPPLTLLGREQAAATGAFFATQPIATIHHSTMVRAAETTQIIAQSLPGVPLAAHDELREGVPTIPDVYADLFAIQPDEDYRPAQVAAHQAKLEAIFTRLFQTAPQQDQHELVVCHGNVIRYLVCKALNINSHTWVNLHPVYHCSLTQIIIAPHLLKEVIEAGLSPTMLFSFNDVHHLSTAQRTFS